MQTFNLTLDSNCISSIQMTKVCIGENQPCGTDEGFDCCGDEVECEVYRTELGRECHSELDQVFCEVTEKKHGRCVNNCRGQHIICSDSSECCKGLTCRPYFWLPFTACQEPARPCVPLGGDCLQGGDCCEGLCHNGFCT